MNTYINQDRVDELEPVGRFFFDYTDDNGLQILKQEISLVFCMVDRDADESFPIISVSRASIARRINNALSYDEHTEIRPFTTTDHRLTHLICVLVAQIITESFDDNFDEEQRVEYADTNIRKFIEQHFTD